MTGLPSRAEDWSVLFTSKSPVRATSSTLNSSTLQRVELLASTWMESRFSKQSGRRVTFRTLICWSTMRSALESQSCACQNVGPISRCFNNLKKISNKEISNGFPFPRSLFTRSWFSMPTISSCWFVWGQPPCVRSNPIQCRRSVSGRMPKFYNSRSTQLSTSKISVTYFR